MKNKEYVLIDKKYNLLDFFIINFKIVPFMSIVKIIDKVINALIPSLQILITAMFIDTALSIFNNEIEYNQIFLPLILIILLIAHQYINAALMKFINLKISMKLNETFRPSIIKKRASLDFKHIENNDTWELVSRCCNNSVQHVEGGFNIVLRMLDMPIRVGSILIILFTQVWWAGLVIIGFSVPLFFIAYKSGKTNYEAFKEANKHERKAGYIDEILTNREGSKERYLFDFSKNMSRKWRSLYETGRKIYLKTLQKNFIRMKLASIITLMIALLLTAVLLSPLSQNLISIGIFIGLVQAVFNLVQVMSFELSKITQEIANNIEYLKDLSAFTKLSENKDALSTQDISISSNEFKSIEFINVSFKYPGTDNYILNSFSLKIESGLHYAFVGVNGSGKTTIIKILTGLYDDFEGVILINNINISEYTPSQLKAMFSVVYQDFAKYYISFKENIVFDNTNKVSEQEIEDIIKTIGLNSAVNDLPNGMDTNLGKIRKESSDLSGGQWQRLAIARALASKAPIRILDEPTASLDPIAESNIYEMFNEISKDRATLLITHRLGATKIVDEIILIDNGSVKEKGTHDDLMAKAGQYAKMYDSQRSWYQ